MQIVIDIPEDIYIHLLQRYKYQDTNDIGLSELDKASIAIKNGTPLPKGHGDLVDRDAINSRYNDIYTELHSYSNQPTYKELLGRFSMCLDTSPTIIEAESESEQ